VALESKLNNLDTDIKTEDREIILTYRVDEDEQVVCTNEANPATRIVAPRFQHFSCPLF